MQWAVDLRTDWLSEHNSADCDFGSQRSQKQCNCEKNKTIIFPKFGIAGKLWFRGLKSCLEFRENQQKGEDCRRLQQLGVSRKQCQKKVKKSTYAAMHKKCCTVRCRCYKSQALLLRPSPPDTVNFLLSWSGSFGGGGDTEVWPWTLHTAFPQQDTWEACTPEAWG